MNGWLLINLPFILADAGTDATNLAKEGAATQKLVADAFDQMWKDVLLSDLSGSSSLYSAISNVGVSIAIVAILFWTVQWAKAMLDGDGVSQLEQLIWPLIVATFLHNNGTVLAHSTIGLRDFINAADTKVLTATASSIELDQAYRQIAHDLGDRALAKSSVKACVNKKHPEEQSNCLKNRKADAAKIARRRPQQQGSFDIGQAAKGLVKSVASGVQLVIDSITRFLLFVMGAAYQWALEISLLLTALLGPLAVGATLLPIPGSQKPLIAWLMAFMSIGLAKISFNIIVGLSAMVILDTSPTDFISLIFSLISGLVAPLFSSMLAKGGGQAAYNGLKESPKKAMDTAVGVALGIATGGASKGATLAVKASKVAAQAAARNASSGK